VFSSQFVAHTALCTECLAVEAVGLAVDKTDAVIDNSTSVTMQKLSSDKDDSLLWIAR